MEKAIWNDQMKDINRYIFCLFDTKKISKKKTGIQWTLGMIDNFKIST